jgi:hypothetical protein
MSAIAHSVAGVAVRGEEGEVCEPDLGAAETAVGEEEWRFSVGGIRARGEGGDGGRGW